MTATANMPGFNLAAFRSWIFDPSSRLDVAIFISIIFHAVVLFGVTFKLPTPKFENAAIPLEVVLKDKAEALLNQINQVILTAVADGELLIQAIKIDPDFSYLTYYEEEKEITVKLSTPTIDD